MINIREEFNDTGDGGFYADEDGEQLGEIAVNVRGNVLTAHHTEVVEKAEGTGLARKLLGSMADYVRKHNLKVVPLCPYIHAQFRRHPAEYEDIWMRGEDAGKNL